MNTIWFLSRSLSGFAIALTLTACDHALQPAEDEALPRWAIGAMSEQAGSISIVDSWVRQPPPSARVAAGYMRIDNPTAAADRLLAVETDAAARVEIHEMEEVDGIMRMREVEGGLELPAASHVELEPGGYHLMLMEPREGLAAGQQVQATLVFEHAGEMPVAFEVRPVDGSAPSHDHHQDDGQGHDHGH